jgi:hypothetical protein
MGTAKIEVAKSVRLRGNLGWTQDIGNFDRYCGWAGRQEISGEIQRRRNAVQERTSGGGAFKLRGSSLGVKLPKRSPKSSLLLIGRKQSIRPSLGLSRSTDTDLAACSLDQRCWLIPKYKPKTAPVAGQQLGPSFSSGTLWGTLHPVVRIKQSR